MLPLYAAPIEGLGLSEEAERCQRRRAGAALVWHDRETEMGDLAEIEALFFALLGGSPAAEVVFLNQNLAVGLGAPSSETSTRTSWVRSRNVSSTS